jgi:opacity protein-like surface antigen
LQLRRRAPPIYATHFKNWGESKRGLYLRKFALLILSVCALPGFAALAQAQQIDLAVGGGTLISTKNINASLNYLPPPERGGTYPSYSFDRIFKNHFGYSAEFAFRYKYAYYNNYQQFRPLLYDVNAVFAPPVAKRTNAIFMAGLGGQTVLFYAPYGNCYYSSGCITHLDSNHFLLHVGGGIQYRVWRNVFVRPEAHLYRIVNNTSDFHSDNVFRVGVSVGYTFHTD